MTDIAFQLHSWTEEVRQPAKLLQPRAKGYLVAGKNAGAHWTRYLLASVLAEHHDVGPPDYLNPLSLRRFFDAPRAKSGGRRKAQVWQCDLPRLLTSTQIPGFGFEYAKVPFGQRAPKVVLVRDLRHVLVAHYERFKNRYGLSWAQFLRVPWKHDLVQCDLWWQIRFLNRWGSIIERMPEEVIFVRYEDLRQNPVANVERILMHYDLAIPHDDVERGVAMATKDSFCWGTDPDFPERVTADHPEEVARYFEGENGDYFRMTLSRNLQHTFGYSYTQLP